MIFEVVFQSSWWSGPVLHELAYSCIHSHGLSTPHSHELKKIGFPVLLSASDCIYYKKQHWSCMSSLLQWNFTISLYCSCGSSCVPLILELHQSIFTSLGTHINVVSTIITYIQRPSLHMSLRLVHSDLIKYKKVNHFLSLTYHSFLVSCDLFHHYCMCRDLHRCTDHEKW